MHLCFVYFAGFVATVNLMKYALYHKSFDSYARLILNPGVLSVSFVTASLFHMQLTTMNYESTAEFSHEISFPFCPDTEAKLNSAISFVLCYLTEKY